MNDAANSQRISAVIQALIGELNYLHGKLARHTADSKPYNLVLEEIAGVIGQIQFLKRQALLIGTPPPADANQGEDLFHSSATPCESAV